MPAATGSALVETARPAVLVINGFALRIEAVTRPCLRTRRTCQVLLVRSGLTGVSSPRAPRVTNERRRLNFPLIRFCRHSSLGCPHVRSRHHDRDAPPVTTPAALRSRVLTWIEWQHEVVAILRRDFQEALDQISLEDVDWAAWLRLYLEGRTPVAAVDRALERDL